MLKCDCFYLNEYSYYEFGAGRIKQELALEKIWSSYSVNYLSGDLLQGIIMLVYIARLHYYHITMLVHT